MLLMARTSVSGIHRVEAPHGDVAALAHPLSKNAPLSPAARPPQRARTKTSLDGARKPLVSNSRA